MSDLEPTHLYVESGGKVHSTPIDEARSLWASQRARTEAAFRGRPFPLYRPVGWTGPVAMGGFSSSGGAIYQLSLIHGYPIEDSGPCLVVVVGLPRGGYDATGREGLVAERYWYSRRDLQDLVADEASEQDDVPLPLPEIATGSILVSGRSADFEAISWRLVWFARGIVDGRPVTLKGSGGFPLANLALEVVDDVETYIEGLRSWEANQLRKRKAREEREHGV